MCKWVEEKGNPLAVEFRCWEEKHLEASSIGYKPEQKDNWIALNPNFQGDDIYMVDILHEMGHIAGLRHEFAR